jgi:hypothetical protein
MAELEIAKRFADLLETKDLNGLQELIADGFTAKGPTMELNKQQTIAYLKILYTAFPDLSFGLTDLEEKGELIYYTSHEIGTHNGVLDLTPFGMPVSLPPSGKTFTLPEGGFTIHVADGKVVYFSEEPAEGGGLAGILAQLGVKLP